MAQATAEEKDEEQPEDTSGYQVAAKATVNDLMEKDKDDEALQKYKAQLLGDAKDKIIDENDPRQVFFDKLIVMPDGRDSIELEIAKLKKGEVAFTLKEGSKYTVKLEFRVQKEIVLGLKRFQRIYKKGLKVDSATDAIGSYAPTNKKSYEYSFGEETTPSGMLARGSYNAKTQFLDDDKKSHLELEYTFKIAKDWA